MNIGIDIVSIKKFRSLKKIDYSHWQMVFTACEWQYAFSKKEKSTERLAGIFAAKEAAMKAFGKVGVKNFREFEISHASSGAPTINKPRCKISIAHNQNTAVAVILKI